MSAPIVRWSFAVALGWAALCWHWLFQGQAIPLDSANYYYPVFRFFAETLGLGQSPAWNPYLLAGHPAIADPQGWYFVTTARLYALFDATPGLRAFAVWQVLHLLGGGLGFLLLGRRLGLSWLAAALGALVFMGGGQALGRLQHGLMVIGYAWLPWCLWALETCFRGPRRWRPWRACGFALLAAAMAVNRDQVAYLNCLLLLGLAAWRIGARLHRRPALGLRTTMHLSPALPVGLALLAVPLLLTLELAALSNRPEIQFTMAAHASLQPFAFLGLVAPDFFGALSGDYWGPGRLPWMALSATGFDWTDESISHLYFGAAPLLLLFAARWRTAALWPYALLLAFTLLYALGGYTPVFAALHAWLPGVDLFRRPADAAFPLNALLALLAAAGLDGLRRAGAGRLAALLAGILLFAIAAVWLALRLNQFDAATAGLWRAAPWLLAALLILLAVRRWPAAGIGLLALVAVDLQHHNAGLPYNTVAADTLAGFRDADMRLAADMRDLTTTHGPWRAEIFGLGGAWQSVPLVARIEQTLGYSPVRLEAYETATGARQNSHTMQRTRPAGFARYDEDLPRRLGIRLVATGQALADPAALGLSAGRPLGAAWLYETASPLPRVVAEPGTARLLRRTTTSARVAVSMAAPGRLVLHDLYYPGWSATANGQPLAVERHEGLFRAVSLPAGQHVVEFEFRPMQPDHLLDMLVNLRSRY